MVLENVGLDIPTVFGPTSEEAQQLAADPSSFKDPETADYIGVAVHCAKGDELCEKAQAVKFGHTTPTPSATKDRLPDEPGGYLGYQALFGHRYVAPRLGAGTPNKTSHGYPVTNANGNLVDLSGNELFNLFANQPGFPGFNPTATQTLAYLADMQEAGIPVTYGYISDIHELKPGTSGCTTVDAIASGYALGPGDPCYVSNAKAYDDAFATFFKRLAADGITPANTLFVIGAEEDDHFAGANVGRAVAPTPAGCDGVTVPCHYDHNEVGELTVNLPGLLATQRGNLTAFDVEPQAAAIYVHGQPSASDPTVRQLERDTAAVVNPLNPYSGVANERIVNYQAGATEQRILHLQTADPLRTPTYTLFPKPDYFFAQGPTDCTSACVSQFARFAWNHGYYSPDIDITWSSLVGPGVRNKGVDGRQPTQSPAVVDPSGGGTVPPFSGKGTWADEADLRPTMLHLLGLVDDYTPDGRVITEVLTHEPAALIGTGAMAACYKQLNASVGTFATDTLLADTAALASGSSAGDTFFERTEAALRELARARDALANDMKSVLTRAAFDNTRPTDETITSLRSRCESLLASAAELATDRE
jgi:hypothetical protein